MSDKITLPEKSDLIFELASEEIPASYQASLVAQWEKKLPDLFRNALAKFDKICTGATPRRIWFFAEGLHHTQKKEEENILGPARQVCFDEKGIPTPALQGFARKAGIEPENVEFVKGPKGEQASARIVRGGNTIEEILPALLKELLQGLRFPRVMKWAHFDYEYPRPISGFYLQYGSKVLKPSAAQIGLPVQALDSVAGHFILHSERVKPQNALAYFSSLEKAKVIANPADRKARILSLLGQAAHEAKLEVVHDEDLVNEVNYLTEYPGVVLGEYPKEYLDLPEAVIISEMKEHQRYFAARDKNGKLSRYFFIVSNGETVDKTTYQNIKAGNERVLKARLSDGNFFLKEDKKKKLADRTQDLAKIVFQEGLGSMADKQERLKKICSVLVENASFRVKPNKVSLERSAVLCKADLTTQLVYEFDHLQGEIGAVYAANDGEDEKVCNAIAQHYMPRNQDDDYPSAPEGVALSLADKLDNIVAGFLTGKQPTSSQDPFGLRRQSIYVIEIFIRNEIRVNLTDLINKIIPFYPTLELKTSGEKKTDIAEEITDFFRGRLSSIFERDGFDKKYIRSALYAQGNDIYDLHDRLSSLKKIALENPGAFADLMTAFKRMANITENVRAGVRVNEELFESEYEKNLLVCARGIENSRNRKKQIVYDEIFSLLASSKKTVDLFFDNVMVNHKEESIKSNRLALLAEFVNAVRSILDLGQLK